MTDRSDRARLFCWCGLHPCSFVWPSQDLDLFQSLSGRFAGFGSPSGPALSLGFGATIVRDVPVDLSLVIHDVAAYILLVAFTCALTISPVAPARLHAVAWMTVLCGSTLLLLQLANSAGWFSLPRIDPWYWDRMRGWCDNPNQFALLCLLLGFMAVALAEKASRLAWSAIASSCAALAFGVGLLAKSNAFLAVVVAGLLLFAFAKFGRLAFRAERSGAPAASLALGVATAIAWVLCAAYPPVTGLDIGELKSTTTMARGGEGDSEDAALRVIVGTSDQGRCRILGSWPRARSASRDPAEHSCRPPRRECADQSPASGAELLPILKRTTPCSNCSCKAGPRPLPRFSPSWPSELSIMEVPGGWHGRLAVLDDGVWQLPRDLQTSDRVVCPLLGACPAPVRGKAGRQDTPDSSDRNVEWRLFWARRAIAQPTRRELSV